MRRSRHAWWLYLALIAPVAVGYLAGPLRAGPVYNAIGFSAVPAMVIGVRMHRPTARWAWYVLAFGEVLFVGGDVLAYNYAAIFGGALPSISIADVFYLSCYPVTAVGLLLLIRSRSPGRDWASLIDAAIVTIGLGLLSWLVLIAPLAHNAALPLGTKLVSIAYPLSDILVLGVAVRLAVGAGPAEPRLLHDRRRARRRPRGRLGLRLEPAPRRLQPRDPARRGLDRRAPAVRSRGAAPLDDDACRSRPKPSCGCDPWRLVAIAVAALIAPVVMVRQGIRARRLRRDRRRRRGDRALRAGRPADGRPRARPGRGGGARAHDAPGGRRPGRRLQPCPDRSRGAGCRARCSPAPPLGRPCSRSRSATARDGWSGRPRRRRGRRSSWRSPSLPADVVDRLERRVAVSVEGAAAAALCSSLGATPIFAVPILSRGCSPAPSSCWTPSTRRSRRETASRCSRRRSASRSRAPR